jgi:hypothetical protein
VLCILLQATVELLERIVADAQLQAKVRAVVAPTTPAVVTADIKSTPPPMPDIVSAPPPVQATQRLGMGTSSLAGSGLPQGEVVVGSGTVGIGTLSAMPQPQIVTGSAAAVSEVTVPARFNVSGPCV